ncbi:hypothetical protein MNB_SV-5-65 [hydrothermal vent metagenome]|uniref:Uncharacterized protein n=1 Tax=hydrothermal vent metagenome TaxID=652676 RepID=A0A1W1ECC0_9ZZZZ
MNGLILQDDLRIKLNNGREIFFKYMSDFDNPIFKLDGDKNKVTIIDDELYSVSGGDYDEPDCPLREEFQATEFFAKYTYNFFKASFVERRV